jgi:hypothetical protein
MIEKSLPWIMTRVPRAERALTGSSVVKRWTRRAASARSHSGVGWRASSAARSSSMRASSASSEGFCAASGSGSSLRRPTGSSFTSAKNAAKA